MKPIETRYKSYQFRSRLEARWAAFFDLVGWSWEYEPFDLNGCVPDFLINEHDKVLVEVKPVTEFPRELAEELKTQAPHGYEILILGCILEPPTLGGLGEFFEKDAETTAQWAFGEAYLGTWEGSESTEKNPCKRIGFCHEYQSFHDRITGCYDGGHCMDMAEPPTDEVVKRHWAKAANRTQWKGSQSGAFRR